MGESIWRELMKAENKGTFNNLRITWQGPEVVKGGMGGMNHSSYSQAGVWGRTGYLDWKGGNSIML